MKSIFEVSKFLEEPTVFFVRDLHTTKVVAIFFQETEAVRFNAQYNGYIVWVTQW